MKKSLLLLISFFRIKLAYFIIRKISEESNIDVRIKLYLSILQNKDFDKIDYSWNSVSQNIITPNKNVFDDIEDLKKITYNIKNKKETKITSGYLNPTYNQIHIKNYFNVKNAKSKNTIIKDFCSTINEILSIYEELNNSEEKHVSYKFMILKQILPGIENSLKSISNMK